MNKEKTNLGKLILVGLTARTNNKAEMDPEKGKIGPLAGAYWSEQIAAGFKHRTNPGVTYSVYTEFESDEHGEYTYFIGEQVNSLEGQDLESFKTLTIEPSTYQKFTTEPGQMPTVVIEAWQAIWQMHETDFGGKRKYLADFEVYDQRAADPRNSVVDIYIGIDSV